CPLRPRRADDRSRSPSASADRTRTTGRSGPLSGGTETARSWSRRCRSRRTGASSRAGLGTSTGRCPGWTAPGRDPRVAPPGPSRRDPPPCTAARSLYRSQCDGRRRSRPSTHRTSRQQGLYFRQRPPVDVLHEDVVELAVAAHAEEAGHARAVLEALTLGLVV